MGGDLLCQGGGEARFFIEVLKHKFVDKELVLYTGAKINEIPRWCFYYFDKIKYGPYVESLKCQDKPYGSSNQGIITKGIDY